MEGRATGAARVRVLLADDDTDVRLRVPADLERSGIEVEAVDGPGCVLTDGRPGRCLDALLLGLTSRTVSGLDVLRQLRTASNVPVVVLAGTGSDGIRGLELGADDYVVKPVSTRELSARIRAVLRRTRPDPTPRVEHGALVIDAAGRHVVLDGRAVNLTRREFDLLHTLAASPSRTFTRSDLLRRVWQSSEEWQGTATVTEHVRRLRTKLDGLGLERAGRIATVRGVGYRFDPADRPGQVVANDGSAPSSH